MVGRVASGQGSGQRQRRLLLFAFAFAFASPVVGGRVTEGHPYNHLCVKIL